MPGVSWGLEGAMGIVVEYFAPLEEGWFPVDPLVVVLVNSHLVFFYEEELRIVTEE